MKRDITKREMINRVLDLANDLHKADNIIAEINDDDITRLMEHFNGIVDNDKLAEAD